MKVLIFVENAMKRFLVEKPLKFGHSYFQSYLLVMLERKLFSLQYYLVHPCHVYLEQFSDSQMIDNRWYQVWFSAQPNLSVLTSGCAGENTDSAPSLLGGRRKESLALRFSCCRIVICGNTGQNKVILLEDRLEPQTCFKEAM